MAKIDKVQEVSIEKLVPYERNAKIHDAEQVKKIAHSIKEFGFINPCLIDKDFNLIAGHGRVLAAKQLGMDMVPCVFVEGLTDEERRAYILADNRLYELGDWNEITLRQEIKDLDFDFSAFDLGDGIAEAEAIVKEPEPVICPRCGHVLEVQPWNI